MLAGKRRASRVQRQRAAALRRTKPRQVGAGDRRSGGGPGKGWRAGEPTAEVRRQKHCQDQDQPAMGLSNPRARPIQPATPLTQPTLSLAAYPPSTLATSPPPKRLSKTILDHVPRHAPRAQSFRHDRPTNRPGRTGDPHILQRAAATADRDPTIVCNLAAACREAGDLPAAIVNYRRAIDLDPARTGTPNSVSALA